MKEGETPPLNRSQKRLIERIQRTNAAKRIKKGNSDRSRKIIHLKPIDDLIDEDGDIEFYSEEKDNYNQSLRQLRFGCQFYMIFKNTGVSEETLRNNAILSGTEGYNQLDFFSTLSREVSRKKFLSSFAVLNNLAAQMRTGKRFIPDDVEVWSELLRDRDIPLLDLYNEAIRSRKETVELLQLQIDWLKDREITGTAEIGDLVEEENTHEISPIVAPPFSLKHWDLKLTTRNWSSARQHLIEIPTGSMNEALESIKLNVRGEIMIKPKSVLNALEFFLSQSVLQRAMAARLKYVPEHMREWIKIKRGRDRILLLVPEEGQAIFFAGNRDEIYRNI